MAVSTPQQLLKEQERERPLLSLLVSEEEKVPERRQLFWGEECAPHAPRQGPLGRTSSGHTTFCPPPAGPGTHSQERHAEVSSQIEIIYRNIQNTNPVEWEGSREDKPGERKANRLPHCQPLRLTSPLPLPCQRTTREGGFRRCWWPASSWPRRASPCPQAPANPNSQSKVPASSQQRLYRRTSQWGAGKAPRKHLSQEQQNSQWAPSSASCISQWSTRCVWQDAR